jgi:tetratricopeptide (TPR) repeat protein
MMLEQWYGLARENYIQFGGPEPDPDNKFATALNELSLFMQQGQVDQAAHLVSLALEWRSHFIEAKQIEQAHSIAVEVWWFIAFRYNQVEDAREMLQSVLETAPKRSRFALLAQIALAQLLMGEGQHAAAIKALQSLEPLANELKDEIAHVRVLSLIAMNHAELGDLRKARVILNKSLERRKPLNDYLGAAVDYLELSRLARRDGQFSYSLEHCDQAERYLRMRQEPALETLGDLYYERGLTCCAINNYQVAAQCFIQALNLYNEIANRRAVAMSLTELAEVIRVGANDLAQALQMVLEAIDITEQLKEIHLLPRKLYVLSLIYEDQGHFDEAVVQSERAIAIGEQVRGTDLPLLREARDRQRRKASRARR